MIIKELNLIGFGKFNNRIIKLKDGLNIVYGENEAGKTTIHNFIHGMFYGFLKPYVTRTIYLEEHAKYAPWNQVQYSGIIRFNHDNRDYRIEREFTKGQEKTSVFLDSTGEDITQDIDTGSVGKVLQPGNHFFGFNNAVFTNTISIGQLGNRTDEVLANEVRERLANASETLDENLDLDKGLGALEGSIKDIGTIRASTSPYGKSYAKLNKLKEEKKSILELKDEYDSLLANMEACDRDLEIMLEGLKELEVRLSKADILSKHKLLLEIKDLQAKINSLREESKSYEEYKNLSMEDYSDCMELNSDIRALNEKIHEYKDALLDTEKKIKELKNRDSQVDNCLLDLEKDYIQYEELEEKLDDLKFNDYNNRLQFLERDLSNNKQAKKSLNFGLIMSVLASIVSTALGLFLSRFVILMANILTIPLSIFFLGRLRRTQNLLDRIDNQFKETVRGENKRKEEVAAIDRQLKEILERYGLKSKPELRRLMEKTSLERHNKEQDEKSLKEALLKKEELVQGIDRLTKEGQEKSTKLDILLRKNASSNLEDFKMGLEKKATYDEIRAEIRSKEDLLAIKTLDLDIRALEAEIVNYQGDISIIEESLTVDELKERISKQKDEISQLKIDKGILDEKINNLNSSISRLVEIDEEIQRQEKFLQEADEKRKALELAKSTIEGISKDIHRQFAPMINRKVGKIIQEITGGRYESVRIADSLAIGVISPETQSILDINSLSGGTIDQLYFALRFGIIDSIRGEGLPLILDDCFIQYDDYRLRNILDFLYEKSKERQIILFTCQRRESRILDEMEADYNLIHLEDKI